MVKLAGIACVQLKRKRNGEPLPAPKTSDTQLLHSTVFANPVSAATLELARITGHLYVWREEINSVLLYWACMFWLEVIFFFG